jgi:hypothetical protein
MVASNSSSLIRGNSSLSDKGNPSQASPSLAGKMCVQMSELALRASVLGAISELPHPFLDPLNAAQVVAN